MSIPSVWISRATSPFCSVFNTHSSTHIVIEIKLMMKNEGRVIKNGMNGQNGTQWDGNERNRTERDENETKRNGKEQEMNASPQARQAQDNQNFSCL